MPKFSVITPVHLWSQERVDKFLKCIKSVENQTFRDFEWIVVNDGSVVDFNWDLILLNKNIPLVTLLNQDHKERVIAYNEAFKVAKGEWFTLLDSDDEYQPEYLEVVDSWTKKYPKFWKMFNFGCEYHHKDGRVSFRAPFEPQRLKVGHEQFGGGNIVNGTFVFHRSLYDKLGAFPGDSEGYIRQVDCSSINYGGVRDLFMGSPWDFAAACLLEMPELQRQYMVECNDEGKLVKELGNPWGNDFFLFYKYTRKYHSKPVKEYLYIVNIR